MKSSNKKNQKSNRASKFALLMQELFESFARKTDSEKRTALVGSDPFRTVTLKKDQQ